MTLIIADEPRFQQYLHEKPLGELRAQALHLAAIARDHLAQGFEDVCLEYRDAVRAEIARREDAR